MSTPETIPIDWPFEKMFANHILVQIDAFHYSGRLVIPEIAKRLPTKGTVIMVGDAVTDIKEGDSILFSQFAGYRLVFEGLPTCRIIGREEALALLKKGVKIPDLVAEGS